MPRICQVVIEAGVVLLSVGGADGKYVMIILDEDFYISQNANTLANGVKSIILK